MDQENGLGGFLSGVNEIIEVKYTKWTERSHGDGDKAPQHGLQSLSTKKSLKKISIGRAVNMVQVLKPDGGALSPAALKIACTSKTF